MFGVPAVLEFLHSHNVEEGSTIRLVQRCRNSVIIGVQDARFVLENEVADRIKVCVFRIEMGKETAEISLWISV